MKTINEVLYNLFTVIKRTQIKYIISCLVVGTRYIIILHDKSLVFKFNLVVTSFNIRSFLTFGRTHQYSFG